MASVASLIQLKTKTTQNTTSSSASGIYTTILYTIVYNQQKDPQYRETGHEVNASIPRGKMKIWEEGKDGHFYLKNIYKTIQRQLANLERNWRTGTTRKLDCGLRDPGTPFTLSDKYLAAA